jgi:glycosyltransferase involved in cell wall biosynthesis
MVDQVVQFQNNSAGRLADAVVTYTRDYGTHSPYLSQFLDKKLHIIPPPVELAPCTDEEKMAFRQKYLGNNGTENGRLAIGISARLATEKGVEVLLNALPIVLKQFPQAMVLHAGPYENILGEEAYAARLAPLFEKYKNTYFRLGTLHDAELTAFYKNLDVLCVPSLNSTESFGLVQIEAMSNHVPVAACSLPGVRQPVTMTGMGEVTEIGDHEALAQAIINILHHKEQYQRDAALIADSFSPKQTAVAYLNLFESIQQGKTSHLAEEPTAYERLRAMRDSFL